MAIKTFTAQLEEIQVAITATLQAESVTESDMSLKRSRLKDLYAAQDAIYPSYLAETGTPAYAVNQGIVKRA